MDNRITFKTLSFKDVYDNSHENIKGLFRSKNNIFLNIDFCIGLYQNNKLFFSDILLEISMEELQSKVSIKHKFIPCGMNKWLIIPAPIKSIAITNDNYLRIRTWGLKHSKISNCGDINLYNVVNYRTLDWFRHYSLKCRREIKTVLRYKPQIHPRLTRVIWNMIFTILLRI